MQDYVKYVNDAGDVKLAGDEKQAAMFEAAGWKPADAPEKPKKSTGKSKE